MSKAKRIFASALIIATLVLAIAAVTPLIPAAKAAPEEKGPRADKLVFIEYGNSWETALLDVAQGKAATFVWGASKEAFEKYRNDQRVKFFLAPSGVHSLLLNPCYNESNPEVFNPFAIKKIRYAMNFLIDREWYVSQVLGGLGKPMYTALSEFSPDYLVILPVLLKHNIKYDFDYAMKLIKEGMQEANETPPWTGKIKFINGKWYYNGKPVTIIGLIRSDDARRKALGEYFANQLEKAGFTVKRKYGTFRELIPIVYLSDPRKLQWHFYTEGWGGGFSRYNDWDPIFYYTTAYWQWQFGTPSAFDGKKVKVTFEGRTMSLDDVAKILGDGKYKSVEERNEAMRVICDVGLSESIRIFVANLAEAYFVNSKVEDAVIDFGYGTGNHWFFLCAKMAGSDTLTIAMVHVTETEPWNWANDDWYTHIIWYATYEYGLYRHPHNGEIIPGYATFKVETKGPTGSFTVPDSALVWDPFQSKWVSPSHLSKDFIKEFYGGDASKATHAKSKVIFNFKFPVFHDGSKESLADIFYGLYFAWQWAVKTNSTDPTYDEAKSPEILSSISQIRGVEVINKTAVAVYIDYWHFDPNEIAGQADVSVSEPWHLRWAEDQLVISGAYSWTNEQVAPRFDERNPQHAKAVADFLAKAEQSGKVPGCLKQLADKGIISVADAKDRYADAIAFIKKYDHCIIGNGPYYVTKVDFVAKRMTLAAWRNPGYPWPVGYWDKFAQMKKAAIASVQVPESAIQGLSFTVNVSLSGISADEIGFLKALVVDSEGNVIASTSDYKVVSSDTVSIPLKIAKSGLFSLRIAVASKDVAIPAVKQIPLKVSAVEPYVKSLQGQLSSAKKKIVDLQAQIAQLQSQLQKTATEKFAAGKAAGYSSGLTTGAIAGLVIGIIIGIIVGRFALKPKPKTEASKEKETSS